MLWPGGTLVKEEGAQLDGGAVVTPRQVSVPQVIGDVVERTLVARILDDDTALFVEADGSVVVTVPGTSVTG